MEAFCLIMKISGFRKYEVCNYVPNYYLSIMGCRLCTMFLIGLMFFCIEYAQASSILCVYKRRSCRYSRVKVIIHNTPAIQIVKHSDILLTWQILCVWIHLLITVDGEERQSHSNLSFKWKAQWDNVKRTMSANCQDISILALYLSDSIYFAVFFPKLTIIRFFGNILRLVL